MTAVLDSRAPVVNVRRTDTPDILMMRFSPRAAAICGLSVLAAVACSDSNAPAKRPNIVLSLANKSQSYSTGSNGYPVVRCDFTIHATNTGNATGSLGAITLYFAFGADRTTPQDTISVANDPSNWTNASLDPNESGESSWYVTGAFPYTATMKFAVNGGPDTASASLPIQCGPVPSVTPPPSITSLDVSMPGGQTPGGTLVIDYAATAASGLWYTDITVRGPCDLQEQSVNDFGAASATHRVSIPVPIGCATGVPFWVTVTAYDAALNGIQRQVASTFSLAGSTMPMPGFLAAPARPAQSSTTQIPCCRRSASQLPSPTGGPVRLVPGSP